MRRLGIAAACIALMWAVIGTGAAQARLDPGFGHNGVVKAQLPLPSPWQQQEVLMAPARDGSAYVHVTRYCNGQSGCSPSYEIFRYSDSGRLDPSFGASGGYALPPEPVLRTELEVDSAGRLLVATSTENALVIRRINLEGTLDTGFGTNGAVSLDCQCRENEARVIPGAEGIVFVVLPRYGLGKVVRLTTDGSLDKAFGDSGAVSLAMRYGPSVGGALPAGRVGPLYLLEYGYKSSLTHLIRISAAGRVDTRFTRASARALRRVDRLGWGISAVLPRRRGTIDLLGSSAYLLGSSEPRKGLHLRLDSDGTPLPGFGKNGLRNLPYAVRGAALGSDGAVVAVNDDDWGSAGSFVFRILPNGRLDHAFGVESVPNSVGDFGLSIVAQTRRRAMVVDRGVHECRSYCPANPKLVRYLEDPTRR